MRRPTRSCCFATVTMNLSLAMALVAPMVFPFLAAARTKGGGDALMTSDQPAVVRDFSAGATGDKVVTVDFFVYGSDGLCVPGSVCGGNLGMCYQLPGEDKERVCSIDENGTYKGRTFQYSLNPVNLLPTTERARGFLPGENYSPDPKVILPATRLANRLLINPEALCKRFIETFQKVEGVRPTPKSVQTGLEVYPRAPGAFKKKIISQNTDTRYYSRGASPHTKFLLFEQGKPVLPFGNYVAMSCILWRRTEHSDFAAGEAVDLMGNRLPGSGFAAWGWQSGYGGLQYGDYSPGLGMYFVPALALGESWDFRYNGNVHIRTGWQQDAPCWGKSVIWGGYVLPGKAYASEFAPVVFGRIPPRKTTDTEKKTQQVMVFDDPDSSYAPQDAFNYSEDKLAVMKWRLQGKGTARILRGKHFFQGGAALLFPGTDVPNSARKELVSEGLRQVTLTTHLFNAPGEGYHPNGAFESLDFASGPKLTISVGETGALTVSRPGEPDVKTGLVLKGGWNSLSVICDREDRSLFLSLDKDFAAAQGKRMKFPTGGGITALEIGKNAAPSPNGNVLFDAIWINPNDNLSESFEQASVAELLDEGMWKADSKTFEIDGQVAYSGKQSLLLPGGPVTLAGTLLQSGLNNHTVQLAWHREPTGGQDSFVELRSKDGKKFLRLRADEKGTLFYRTEIQDWTATDARLNPEFLENWYEVAVEFDRDGNAYLRMNLEWVGGADGLPLIIADRGGLTDLVIGREGNASGTPVYFDDVRVLHNWTLVGDATLYSSSFEYPLDPGACLKHLGWKVPPGARLEVGKGATGGRRFLVLPTSVPAEKPMVRQFEPELSDVTVEFSWFHDPEAGKRVDAGYVQIADAHGKKLSLSSDDQGIVRYRVNDKPWSPTDYKLVKGWNKVRVVLSETKPSSFWLAPQRTGIHPKQQWILIGQDTYSTKTLKTDCHQKLDEVLTGLSSIEIGRNSGAVGDFLFDDLFVLTNKPSQRDTAQPDIGNIRQQFANELDNRLANRDWPQIEKILNEPKKGQ